LEEFLFVRRFHDQGVSVIGIDLSTARHAGEHVLVSENALSLCSRHHPLA
jgi:hypothetical protein